MDNKNEKIKFFKTDYIKRPFKHHDVSDCKKIYIEGYKFPIDKTSKKLIVKEKKELKKPTYHHQMKGKLEQAGVTFNENEELLLQSILPSINYYRLSVFSLYLENDKSFTHLFNLYQFDRFLMESINRLTPSIEILLKTTLAYFLSTEYEEILTERKFNKGTLVYLDESIYKKKHISNKDVERMLSSFSEFIHSKQDKDPSIKHHIEYYEGNIPVWVLVEQMTMGNVATFVTYLERSIRKEWVRSFLNDVNDKWVIEWIKTIQFLRNTGAHCSRFYGKRFNYNPTIHKNEKELVELVYRRELENLYLGTEERLKEKMIEENLQKKIDKFSHTLFSGLIIMKKFYQELPEIEQRKWHTFIDKLENRIDKYNVDIYRIGMTENWKSILEL